MRLKLVGWMAAILTPREGIGRFRFAASEPAPVSLLPVRIVEVDVGHPSIEDRLERSSRRGAGLLGGDRTVRAKKAVFHQALLVLAARGRSDANIFVCRCQGATLIGKRLSNSASL